MIFPFRTCHRSGTVGIVAVIIGVLSVVTQIAVQIDNGRVAKDRAGAIAAWHNIQKSDTLISNVHDQLEVLMITQTQPDSQPKVKAKTNQDVAGDPALKDPIVIAQLDSIQNSSLQNHIALIAKHPFVPATVTHLFFHKQWILLLVNFWFLYVIALMLEQYWGALRFGMIYTATGIVSAFLFYLLTLIPGVGANSMIMSGSSVVITCMMGALWKVGKILHIELAYFLGVRKGVVRMPLLPFMALFLVWQVFYGILIGKTGIVEYLLLLVSFGLGITFALKIPGKPFVRAARYHQHKHPEKPAKSQEESESVGEPVQTTTPKPAAATELSLIENGWQLYAAQDFTGAVEKITEGINKCFFDIPRFRATIESEIDKLFSVFKTIKIPAETWFEWARRCETGNMKKPAWLSYELAAQMSPKDPDFRMRMILKSAVLRSETPTEKEKATKLLYYIIQNDQDGKYVAEAKLALGRIR